MNGYNSDGAMKATIDDAKLLRTVHPVASRVVEFLGKRDVVRIPKIGVVVSDPDLIRKIFLDRQHFTKTGDNASAGLWNPVIGDTGLLNMDGDPHLRLRRELSPVFSQKIIPALVTQVFADYVDSCFDGLLDGGQVDITQVSSLLAYRSLWVLLGLPAGNVDDVSFEERTRVLRSVTEGASLYRKTLTVSQQESAREKLSFVEKLAVESYQNPTPGSVIEIMKNSGYTVEETVSLTKALMVTGTETIISYIPRMVQLFITSGFLGTLSTEPGLLDDGLDEAFRVTVPTPAAVRSCVEDYALDGVSFKKGDRVVLSTVEACRKFGVFNPFHSVDKSVKGLWFGAGVHMCIGLPVAKAEATTVATKLIEINKIKPLKIVSKLPSTRGHTGSYEKLVISV